MMASLLKSLSAPLLSLILMMLGSGFFNTFTSLRLEIAGYSTETIGIATSALYVGILVGSLHLTPWISKVGHVRALIVFTSIATLLTIFQSFWIDALYWILIRFGLGVCMAGIFIVIESWLLLESPLNMRGRILSVYLAVFYGALSSGQFLINLTSIQTSYPFWITAFLFILSLLPVLAHKDKGPKPFSTEKCTLTQLFKMSPVGFLGGIISGMLLAAVYGLVPVYAKEIGMDISQIGTLMAIIIFGGLCLQWPLGVLADQTNRKSVLSISAWMASFFAIAIAFIPYSFTLFLCLSWFFGGFSFTIYPLSMAFCCEKISQNQIVSATAGFVLAYGLGAIVGPLLAPLAMTLFGLSGLFYFLAAITAMLGISGFCMKELKKFNTESTERHREKK
jgi:MFS family permease